MVVDLNVVLKVLMGVVAHIKTRAGQGGCQ